MLPQDISINEYSYILPEDRIAKFPLETRDKSKLLVWKNGRVNETHYKDLADHIPGGSLLVFNNTKVIEARLLFSKENGGIIEIFCLEPHEQYADITSAMLQKEKVFWKCLIGGAKKWKEGSLAARINHDSGNFILEAKKIAMAGDSYLVELTWSNPDLTFAEVLHMAGHIPLPPYLNRLPDETDKERYQTIYAEFDGSVAAPTAGLHFTTAIFENLAQKNISHDFVTLHVGAGTFKPVKADSMRTHDMHAEFIEVRRPFIENLLQKLSMPVVTVGTTSLRTIESLYWLGVKTILHPEASTQLQLSQWFPFESCRQDITASDSLNALLNWMIENKMEILAAQTQILITPGYRFRIVNALITNFHQPRSTLLLLVAAIAGIEWRNIYAYALANDFRFLSYGDGSLLWLEH